MVSFFIPEIPTVVIDGKTVRGDEDSPAILPLGTTLVLACHVSGIPNGIKPIYTWTCPNKNCTLRRYVGRSITDNDMPSRSVLAINITSVRDSGMYTCLVTAKNCNDSREEFHLKVSG